MRLDNNFNLDLTSEYRIKEIIFVNSGSNYYTRLPVDTHAALLSGNNKGKTSTLAALKLFLLPEVNFKKSADKFGFASGGRYFSDIDSFQYYFPGTESYIICNAENPIWRKGFCWILFRTTDLGYQRIAVPHPYDTIENLFWNDTSTCNDGAGQLQSDIGITSIKKTLLSKEYSGVIFSDRTTIGEAIYTRTSTAEDHTRFSLLPMSKRFTPASVDTVRALLGMAFSLGDASTSTLPMAIGSIIDGMGLSVVKDDGVFVDLDAALDEWQRLKGEDERLSLIERLKPKWIELKTGNEQYKQIRNEVKREFESIANIASHELTNINKELKISQQDYNIAEQKFNEANILHNKFNNQFIQKSAELKAHEKQSSSIKNQLEDISKIRQHFAALCLNDDRSDAAILQTISEHKDTCTQYISSLKDESNNQARLTSLLSRIKSNSDEIAQLTKSLDEQDRGNTFLDHFNVHTRCVLLSLNSGFSLINHTPSSEECNSIERFSSLFTDLQGSLAIGNMAIPGIAFKANNPEEQKQEIRNAIAEKNLQLERHQKQLDQLSQAIKMRPEERAAKLAENEKHLERLNNNERDLKGVAALEAISMRMLTELSSIQQAEKDANISRESSLSQLNIAKEAFKTAKQKLADVEGPAAAVKSLWSDLENLSEKNTGLLDLSKATARENINPVAKFELATIRDTLSLLRKNISDTHEKRDYLTNRLQHLMNHGIIESSPEDRHAIAISQKSFYEYLNAFDTLYNTIDRSRESYKEQLHAHNNTAATSARIIENIKGIIETFIDGINQELCTYRISNLDGVEIITELHPQYVAVIDSMNKVSSSIDALLSESFYKSIRDFQSNFYITKTGKIDLSKIIEKVSYRFDRNGKKEAIPQSNGTNCMVNAVLLALLLKRMIPEDLQLSIPVIFDEVGSLDENNLSEILKVMEEHGLTLFAANPDATGVIASVLNVYHDLSCFQATDVEVQGKAEWIYFPGMEERLVDLLSDQSPESIHEEAIEG